MDDDEKTSKITFLNHMFKFDDDTKFELSNLIQYTGLAIIPVVILNKLMKHYIPDADEEKGSLEITFEIIMQILLLIIGIYYIHRLVTYVPTYSESEYPDLNATSFILIFLIIILSLQSKLGEKINILVNRIIDLWNGESKLEKAESKPKTVQQVNQQRQQQQIQQEELLQMQMQQQSQMVPQQQPKQTLPDYNMMYNNPISNDDGLMAANEALGGGYSNF